ncbi:MAG: UvrB/UvrC motif-containing protein [Candidatus Methylomirabilales bacterium]
MCERCRRKRAEVHILTLKNGALVTAHLCSSCAGLVQEALECQECGLTVEEVIREERVGCQACYQAFAPLFATIFDRVAEACHVEPTLLVPSPVVDQRRLRLLQLRAALRQAVSRENYEEAARLRDEIQKLTADLPLDASGPWTARRS